MNGVIVMRSGASWALRALVLGGPMDADLIVDWWHARMVERLGPGYVPGTCRHCRVLRTVNHLAVLTEHGLASRTADGRHDATAEGRAVFAQVSEACRRRLGLSE